MKMYKLLLNLLLGIIVSGSVYGQSPHIEINIKGMADSSFILAYHYGNKQFIYDSLVADRKAVVSLEGEEAIPQGVYLFVLPSGNYFEFLIGDDQEFSISADPEDLMSSLKFKGSDDNTAFLEYQSFIRKAGESNMHIQSRINSLDKENDSIKIYQDMLEASLENIESFKQDLYKDHPGSFVSDLIMAMSPPEVPEFDVPANTDKPDSVKMAMSYAFYRDHFFDGFNFANGALIRSPVYQNKLSTYFNRILIQYPDSIIPQLHKIVDKSRANDDMFQYTVVFVLNNAIESKIMGMDAVFVDVAESYYLSGEADWVDSAYLEKIKERVNKTRPNLIGAKAKDLKMESISGEWVSLHETDAEYIVLYFWEPNCGHCKKTSPILYDIYTKYKDRGLKVFAVETQAEREEWENYVEKNGLDWINAWDPHQLSYFRFYYDIIATPTIYLLDRNKTIIAKRIDVEQLEKMLEQIMAD